MDAGHNKTSSGIGGQQHMKRLRPRGRIEHRSHRTYSGRLTVQEKKASRRIHPGVGENHKHSLGCSGYGDEHARSKMRLGWKAVPSVEINAEENRFREKSETFQ